MECMDYPWLFEEKPHAGAEHLDPDQVANYDEKIPFDPSEEIDLLKEYGLSENDIVVDFGTGTGSFSVAVADHCSRVVGIDISSPMIDIARKKVASNGIQNIDLVEEGWLSYDHEGAQASVVFSKNTLHHLPNFWKIEALKTVRETLEPGGIFRLRDLVYSFDPMDSHTVIESWLDGMESTPFTMDELHRHFREEYSTYGFILEAMLEETGFEILDATYRDGFYASYTCRLPANL